jgi:transporter family-2 protein
VGILIPGILLAIVIGAGSTIQAGINAQLAGRLGHVAWAALFSVFGSALLLLSFLAVGRFPVAEGAVFRATPWWMWTGGIIGAVYLVVAAFFAPRLGAAFFMALVILGQLVAAMILDQLGVLGFASRGVTPGRVFGALLVLLGAIAIRRF